MSANNYAIILAGGKGERFWPMSTAERPKQFLSLTGDRPLIASAVERLDGLIPPDRVFVITNANLVEAARRVLPSLPKENVIGEPVGRDTAAAVTLGAALVKARDADASFSVLTADHIIGDMEIFGRTLKEAFDMTSSDVLITIGIKPSFASTGFGYIEAGKRLEHPGQVGFFKVKRFVEKPDSDTAQSYLESGSFYWNSGMFVWSVKTYEHALAAHCRPLKRMLNELEQVAGGDRFDETLESIYATLEKISIDYALMEKADNIIVAKGEFAWDDVGSWTALENHLEKDADCNTVAGQVETVDSSGNIVVSEQGMIALCGVSDMVVVRTADATLVCPKDRAQDVKRLVERIGKRDNHRD